MIIQVLKNKQTRQIECSLQMSAWHGIYERMRSYMARTWLYMARIYVIRVSLLVERASFVLHECFRFTCRSYAVDLFTLSSSVSSPDNIYTVNRNTLKQLGSSYLGL